MAEKKKFPVFWVCFAVFTALMVVFWGVVIKPCGVRKFTA